MKKYQGLQAIGFTMLLACVQTDVSFADLESNQASVESKLIEAARRGADLAVFPECVLTGYGYDSRDEAMESAISAEHEVFAKLTELSRFHGTALTLGFLERAGDCLYNASALIDGEGVRAVYRKIHLPHLGVDRFVDRGSVGNQISELPLQDRTKHDQSGMSVSSAIDQPSSTPDRARIGMAICYDCSFPEPMRVLGLAGADVIALGTNWPVAAARTAEIVPPARSMENHLFFVAANRVGTERGFSYCGKSSICGPDGVLLAAAKSDEETILYADVDVAQARNKRIERTVGTHVIDRFADRRPEHYGAIASP